MIYEVVNPSDPVTIEADDEAAAGVAVLLLGEGAYGMTPGDVPILIFSGAKAREILDAWLAGHGIADLNAYIEANRPKLASILGSAMVARPGDREALVAAMKAGGGDLAKAMAAFNEERRSSMNNICGRAHQMARLLGPEGGGLRVGRSVSP